MFDVIQFDVSGICNAKCTWCVSGQKNLKKEKFGQYIEVNEFKRAVKHLQYSGFIEKGKTWLAIYMWGDPFLHPSIKEIVKFLHDENVPTGISTNGSKVVLFEEKGILSNIRHIWFSMPGFSQRSYDKIHGFNFEKILSNIITMSQNFYKMGCKPGSIKMIFHLYQFNLLELAPAIKFANENGLSIYPYAATFNGYEMTEQYFNSEMDYELLKKASQELFLFNLSKEYMEQRPADYICEQFRQLTINDDCRAVLCCGRSDVDLGNIFDLSPTDINRLRMEKIECKDCRERGFDYLKSMPLNEVLPIIKY